MFSKKNVDLGACPIVKQWKKLKKQAYIIQVEKNSCM